jgi:hypothetical protein
VHTPEYLQIEGGKNIVEFFCKKKNTLKGKSVKNIFLIFFKKPPAPRRQEKGENQLEIIFLKFSIKPPAATYLKRGENQLNFLENLIMNLYP